jgi:hypothetical protein
MLIIYIARSFITGIYNYPLDFANGDASFLIIPIWRVFINWTFPTGCIAWCLWRSRWSHAGKKSQQQDKCYTNGQPSNSPFLRIILHCHHHISICVPKHLMALKGLQETSPPAMRSLRSSKHDHFMKANCNHRSFCGTGPNYPAVHALERWHHSFPPNAP